MGISGYNVVGKNMNAVKFDDGAVVLDMGWDLTKILSTLKQYDPQQVSTQQLLELGAIPNIDYMGKWVDNTRAVVLSHAHLDHIMAAPHLLQFFDCPIIATPFTLKVLKRILAEHRVTPHGELIPLLPGKPISISKDIEVEFIHVTHSTLQTAIVALHSGGDTVLYANDWKFDNAPVIGKTTDIRRLKKIGKQGVKLFVSDSVNIASRRKTFSESVVQAMFKDVLLNVENQKKAVFITTFASHLARIKTIISFADKMNRRVAILGRSMKNYIQAGQEAGLIDFRDVEVRGSFRESRSLLKDIRKSRGDYLVITTGHQGEEGSTLDQIASGHSTFKFNKGDQVIFSSKIIPHPVNIAQRAKLEEAIIQQGARIFSDVHVSGHGSREDHRDMIRYLNPDNYVPCHTPIETRASAASLVQESGYELGKSVHLIQEGQKVDIK